MPLLKMLLAMPEDPFEAATNRAYKKPFTDEEKAEARRNFNLRLANHFAYKMLEESRMLARRARRTFSH